MDELIARLMGVLKCPNPNGISGRADAQLDAAQALLTVVPISSTQADEVARELHRAVSDGAYEPRQVVRAMLILAAELMRPSPREEVTP